MSENKVSEESAEKQMQDLLDYYEIEAHHITTEHGQDAIQTINNRLVAAIQKGRLEIGSDDEGRIQITQHLKHPPGDSPTIIYGEVTAKAKLATDGLGETKNAGRVHAFMGSLSGLGPGAIGKLRGVDMGVMEKLFLVFSII